MLWEESRAHWRYPERQLAAACCSFLSRYSPSAHSHTPTQQTNTHACRDLLRAYAARQQFKVRPAPKSRCYTGDLLLEQFGTPFRQDAETVATAYPWLRGYDAGEGGW